jgi:hypothetical protein
MSDTTVAANNAAKSTTTNTTNTTATHKGHPMIYIMLVGLGMLALFAVVFVAQIQTNEAYIQHSGSVSIFHPDWSIVMQIPALITGQLSSSEAAAAIVGWGIELLYLGFVVGYEILKDSVHIASGPAMAKIFRSLGWVIIAFNGYTDYLYGTLGSGIGGHIAFALMCSAIVAYFGTIGWALISFGWRKA